MSNFKSLAHSPSNPFDIQSEGPQPIRTIRKDGRKEDYFEDDTVLVGDDDNQQNYYPNVLQPSDHDANLVDIIPVNELREIGSSLKRLIEDDIESQSQNFESIARFIDNLGIDLNKQYSDSELPFEGAATVHSPAAFESILEIVSLCSTEIFKTSGMVDTVIMGEATEKIEEDATREKEWFNYFFDSVDRGFRKEANRTIWWAAVAGSIYKKVFYCPVLGRVTSLYIPVRDLIVNKDHSSHLSSTRKTHILRLSENEYKMRVMQGMYRDDNIIKSDSNDDEDNPIQVSLDATQGYNPSIKGRRDSLYKLYESHTDYRIKADPSSQEFGHDIALPYRITLDENSGEVIGVYRNWKMGDPLKKRKEYFVNYSMLPAGDGEGYGLVHYAGKSSEAATSLLRLMINTAKYANFPGGIFSSNTRLQSNSIRPCPGEWIPVKSSDAHPLSQSFVPFPYRSPGPELQVLYDQLQEGIRKPGAIISTKLAEVAPSAPVGTVAMMLDGMHKITNAILQTVHQSFTEELALIKERLADHFPDNVSVDFMIPGGQYSISKEDFHSPIRIVPSSDPTTKNSTYRMVLAEIILDKASKFPDIFNMKVSIEYFLENVGVSKEDRKKLLTRSKDDDVQPPQPMDPISTMQALSQGQPVGAAVWQAHDAYIAIIDSWMQTNPQSPHLPQAMALKENHEAFKYYVDAYAQLGMQPPEDPSQLTPDQQNEMAVALAHIKAEEAQKAAAATTPPEPPLDPARVALEEVNAQAQSSHEKHQLEARKLDLEERKIEMEWEMSEKNFALKMQVEELKQGLSEKKLQIDAFKAENEQILRERDQAMKERDSMFDKVNKPVEKVTVEEKK